MTKRKLTNEEKEHNKLIRSQNTTARVSMRKRDNAEVNKWYKQKYGRKKRSDAGKKRK